ncbi:MAG: SpoIIE family protein phosphatase [Candidatus Omnitrophica bacterium]|nr:SpoIIE family protein phosphatase [Candidatus Omnitrophota bacterium]
MFRNRSLAFKFILFFSGSCSIIFLSIIGLNFHLSRRIILSDIQQNAENIALRAVNKINGALSEIEEIPQNLALAIESGSLNKQEIDDLLRLAVANNDEIYGMGIAFEPYAFDPGLLYFAPYYAKEKKGLVLTYLGDDAYRYFFEDWYQIPRELNAAVWSEPYFDDIMMGTYSVPFYYTTPYGPKLHGIICADVSLEHLTAIVNSVRILKTGDAYLVSRNGTIITHADKDLIMNETIFTVAARRNDPALRRIGREMTAGKTGFVPYMSIVRNKKSWMYYTPVPASGWSLAVVFPEDELFADIRRNTMVSAGVGIFGILLLVAVIAAISHSITKPLRRMAHVAQAIGKGDLDAVLPGYASGDEVGRLTQAFAAMKDALKDYIRRLTEATAARERIESELKIAREIQTGILPRIFPAFPDRKEFDIFAMMEPAKEVGGDFYDFALVNETKLYFAMGDVSGKGVPAALFMMITKTLLKNEALQGSAPAQILARVNNILALDNNTSMFATVLCGVLDTRTGAVEFANAGHNPPLVCPAGGHFEYLAVDKGFVLGPMAGFAYKQSSITLGSGDTLFLYTDGVTEAMDPEKKFFTEEGLRSALQAMEGQDIKEMVLSLRRALRDFAKDEPQSDDITMLAVRFS